MDERLVSKMEGKTNFSRHLYRLSKTGIVECLEIIDDGCDLKQFGGLTWLTLTPMRSIRHWVYGQKEVDEAEKDYIQLLLKINLEWVMQ